MLSHYQTLAELALIAAAVRKLTDALYHAGLPPIQHLTQPEIDALAKLMDLCPAGPVEVNGDANPE